MIELRGSTWDHTRGYAPLPVTAEAYSAAHPDVRIVWEKRTLRDFAEMSLPQLAPTYDLIVLDHPWIGGCVAAGALLPLDRYLSADYLSDQARNSVGKSHASYAYDGHQWALAVDAAAQVSAYRPDLLERHGAEAPRTWDEVFALAWRLKRAGTSVSTPLMHVDCFPCFFSLCANAGEQAFTSEDTAVSRAVGRHALDIMRRLAEIGHPEALKWNPPQILDRMSTTDEVAYSPLLFGYTNYARPGYRDHLVRFANIPADISGKPNGAILGGAGLAISSACQHPDAAADYAAFVASGEVQRGMYFECGGQPGYRGAWLDARTNAEASDFFAGTLATLDGAALRPRYDGWIAVQDAACRILHQFLTDNGSTDRALDALDDAYRRSLAARTGEGSA
ncbi:MAG: extracellular solute-binding protein [Anaerolineae bacterium]|nr:extracellular solute-binding protein [Anaerolineae bacterium]